MESYKDVIVSQPPAMYAQAGYTTQFSVENYKGILLCERPSNLASVAGGAGGDAGGGSGSATPFIPSNPTGNPVGYAPSKETRALNAEHVARRLSNQRQHQLKSCQALSRHRRWLRSFAHQMKAMKESDRQCEVAAARRAARVRDNEQQKKAEQQQQQQPIEVASSQAPAAAPYDMQRAMQGHVATTRKAAAPASRKPKWAMTEEEAVDDELDIDRDLLDFAEHLDYERFISDFEVAEALGVMRDRVVQIAKANDWSVDDIRRSNADDDDDLDSLVTPSEAHVLRRQQQQQRVPQPGSPTAARAALPGSAAEHAHDWDSSSTGRGRLLKKAISRDAVALAERLFAASPSLQKIHTKQSLARVLQRCALEGHVDVTEAMLLQAGGQRGAAKATASPPPPPSAAAKEPVAIPEPVVVQVSADALPLGGAADGGNGTSNPPRILRELQQSKERTQGLPYLYRCPAI